MRDEVVWDDEERDDVMSLDMTDRVMAYQYFQGTSTPADVSSNVLKNGRRKGRRGLGSSRHFRKTPLFSASTSCPFGLPSMASPPLPQCGCYACSPVLCL